METPQFKHDAAYCWVTYRAKDDGELIQVFNPVDEKVPLVAKIKGREYEQVEFNTGRVTDYQPKVGDLIFRYLTKDEQDKLAELEADRMFKNRKGMNLRKVNKATLRRELIQSGKYRHITAITKITEIPGQ